MITITESAKERIQDILSEEDDPSLKLRMFVQGGGCAGFSYGFTLDTEQNEDDFEFPAGTAKVLVDNMAMLYDKGLINAALIIAPKGVYRNWYSSEIPTHLPSHIQYNSVLWTASTSKAKDKEYQDLFNVDYNLHILLMNVEALSTPRGYAFARKFLNSHKALFAVDESTTIKNHKANRTTILVVSRITTRSSKT